MDVSSIFGRGLVICGISAFVGCTSSNPSTGADRFEGERRQALGIQCENTLTITGQIKNQPAIPEDVSGCWAAGNWQFQTTITGGDCPGTNLLASTYDFEVSVNEEEEYTYTYVDNTDSRRAIMKVSSGGGGECEGGFEIFSADGTTVINLKPALQEDGSITGQGHYTFYAQDEWPGDED